MEDFFKWLLTAGGEISLTGFLLGMLVVIGYGRYKGWWIDGPTHTQCKNDIKELRGEIQTFAAEQKTLAARNEARVTELERLLFATRPQERSQ